MREHSVPAYGTDRLVPTLGESRAAAFEARLGQVAAVLKGRRLINVTGDDRRKGGVYEIMRATLPYLRGAGVNVVWVDLSTRPEDRQALEFFHVLAHGCAPSVQWRDELASRASEFARFGHAAAVELKAMLDVSDLVVLHDTQSAPVIGELAAWHDRLVWHAHIGTGDSNDLVTAYWQVVCPSVATAAACVFYRPQFAPSALRHRSVFASPGVDPSSPKNAHLDRDKARTKLADSSPGWPLNWVSAARPVSKPRGVIAVQLSRWDTLKDMPGAYRVFSHIAQAEPSFTGLVVGPSAQSSAERRQLELCVAEQQAASRAAKSQVHIGVIEQCGTGAHDQAVRVLQSASDIILQKSVQEGFGLTITEAMLRGKPVAATAVGGIPLQLQDGCNGILLKPGADDHEWATRLHALVTDAQLRSRLGERARVDAVDHHIVDRHLTAVIDGVAELLTCV
jgi:trehalose synthase